MPGPTTLGDLLAGLEGDAKLFAERHSALLLALDHDDLALWVELAEFLSPQRLRDKRRVLGVLAEGFAALAGHPEQQAVVHEAAERLAARSARLVGDYLALCREIVSKVSPADFQEITELALDLSRDVDLAASFMEYAPAVLARRNMTFLRGWQAGATSLARTEWWAARGFLQAIGKSAHWIHLDDLPILADLGEQVAERSRHGVKGLYNALPSLVASMPVPQLVEWVELGLQVTQREDEFVLYMSYGSKRSQEAVEFLCKETSFSAFRGKIALMLEAFLGRPASVRSMYDLLDPASIPPDVPSFSDGGALYVRPSLGSVGTSPFALYKLVALHAAAHERFGTFADEQLAEVLLAERALPEAQERLDDVDRFLVSVAEDFRVDSALFRTLPGLRRDAQIVIRDTYGDIQGWNADRGLPLTPPSLRAHLAAFPFGVRILGRDGLAAEIEAAVAPLAELDADPGAARLVAKRLRALVEPAWSAQAEDGAELDLVGVPHPPYYDYLLLGLKLASLKTAGGDAAEPATPPPGTPIDVPGSLHPSEIIEGLEISFKEKQEKTVPDEIALYEDDGEGEEVDVGECDLYSYPEWDHEVGDHRRKWCTVRERRQRPGNPGFVADTLARYQGEVLLIRRQFERLRPDRIRRYFRQQDGDELDMDALVEALVDGFAGAPMNDNVFIRRDKKKREVAVLFLLDMSDSTDQIVDGSRRVIDVEKEGLVLLAEAIGQLDDQYAMMGFSSHGRKMVDLFVIKDFGESYDEVVAGRIGGIEPLEYTRLGAALRHGIERLKVRDAQSKILVLLSDGRPYDLGYGDLQYAMEDTKMALSEGRRQGVNAFCITVDPKGHDYLEDLFGVNRYTVIQHVGHLPTKLPRIYRNLTV